MRVIRKGLIAGASAITAVALSQTNSRSGPYSRRTETCLCRLVSGSGSSWGPITPNSLNGGEVPFPEFHDVYIERKNLL